MNFLFPFIDQNISVYTDGSKKDVDSAVIAAVFSLELGLALKHKLFSDSFPRKLGFFIKH